jgi:hypothetical protein
MNDIVTATGLSEGDLIEVQVTAYNVQGDATEASDLNTSGVTVKVKPQTPTAAPTRNSATGQDSITVDFGPLDSSLNGGSAITSYILEIYYNDVWTEVIGITTDNASTLTVAAESPDFTIVSGTTYTFRWSAKNIYGTSDPSPTTDILAASKPQTPDAVSLSVTANGNLEISWSEPTDTGGTNVAISSYLVTIIKSDGTYVERTSL